MLSSIIASVIEWFLSKFVVKAVEDEIATIKASSVAEKDAASIKEAKSDEDAKAALESVTKNTFGPS